MARPTGHERGATGLAPGAMDWAPNHQGVSWFVQNVWPLVRQAHPDAQVALAGRNMGPEWTSNPSAGVHVLGEVDDAAATYDTPSVVVVPLHAGSGMRIKIAEALAAGRPIVTTTKGMTGLPLKHGEHVMVADSATDFAEALADLLSDGARPSPWANADEHGPSQPATPRKG